MDPNPDPAISLFPSVTVNFLLLFEGTFTSLKRHKEVTKQYESMFFYNYFCLMIEGSEPGAGSGSLSLANGSGSGRFQNI
jgi:hypothetical protein